ncbi:MAG TPA: signal recognition particle protein [Steroidobacteraceae bacterium]|nr:signal recognition particle protein [Steroidobacteraceae bacterium]
MFDKLSERLTQAVNALRGRGRITEENVGDTLRQVRMALLEADVALPVVKEFIDRVKARALGTEVNSSLTPGQAFIKIIHTELVQVLGEPARGLNLRAEPPVVVLLAGLQGAGKTTTAAKLARWLAATQKKKALLTSTDVYRPAAMLQLERLAGDIGAAYWAAPDTRDPAAMAKAACDQARRGLFDVLIVDTAGRLHVDADMMEEIRAIDQMIAATERLFVVDAMAGQDAVNAARAFNEALSLTGIVLTKADGDSRGGAALSVRHVTGQPILFYGLGEKTDALELFHPDRIASRILGMGDVLGLVEEVEQKVDREKAEKLARKIQKGHSFDLVDLRDQLQQLHSMGGIGALMEKLPAGGAPGGGLKGGLPPGMDDKSMKHQIALIDSMTPRERRFPAIIDGSRKRRIAAGAGLLVPEVNKLLKQFLTLQKMMKKVSKGGLRNFMRSMGGQGPRGPR